MCDKSYAVMLLKQYRNWITDIIVSTRPEWKELSSLKGSNNINNNSDDIRLEGKDDAEIDTGCKDDVSHDRKRQKLIAMLEFNMVNTAISSTTQSPALTASSSCQGYNSTNSNKNIIEVRTLLNPPGTKENL